MVYSLLVVVILIAATVLYAEIGLYVVPTLLVVGLVSVVALHTKTLRYLAAALVCYGTCLFIYPLDPRHGLILGTICLVPCVMYMCIVGKFTKETRI